MEKSKACRCEPSGLSLRVMHYAPSPCVLFVHFLSRIRPFGYFRSAPCPALYAGFPTQ